MNHVGPYVKTETGESADLNFTYSQEINGDFNTDDLFRSAIAYFEGDTTVALRTFDSSLSGRYNYSNPMNPTDREVFNVITLPFEEPGFKEKVESEFKNLYGVELNKENVEFAYRNTTYLGKGFNGEQGDVPRPLFKYNGEIDDDNMHLLAFTLCRAVECKAMKKPLGSGANSSAFEDTYKFNAFDPKESPVFFQAPGKEPVSFDADGMEKPKEPVMPEKHQEPKPKWYQKVAATLLFFTSAGKRAQEAIDRYNNAEKKYNEEEKQFKSDSQKMAQWEKSDSAESEKAYNENKQKFEGYYEKQHERSGENSFTKSSVKDISLKDVKTNEPNYAQKEHIDYSAMRNSTNIKDNVTKKTNIMNNA